MIASGNIISPLKITTASLRGLWVPDWETGQVANAGCSQLTDFSGNGYHLTQATGSLQPLFKKDTLFGGKWYIKPDGIDDMMSYVGDPLSTNNGQLIIIGRVVNLAATNIFECSKLALRSSSGVSLRVRSLQSFTGLSYLFSSPATSGGTIGASGYSSQLGMILARQTATSTDITINGSISTSSGGHGDPLPSSGIQLFHSTTSTGFTTNYWSGEVAAVILYEGTNLTANDLSCLLNWSHREFEVYRDLFSNKI
jgi:hypothetical protein